MNCDETLRQLVQRYRLESDVVARYQKILELLAADTNAATSVREPSEAAEVHIADSLSVLEIEDITWKGRAVDIGSGAGFPGLVLAIARPDMKFDLLESQAKKLNFARKVLKSLGLRNVELITERAEQWASVQGRERYQLALVRAVDKLPVLLEYASPLLKSAGSLIAWKGGRGQEDEKAAEAAEAKLAMELTEIRAVDPHSGSKNRHLYLYKKIGPTPEGFPRRPGIAHKRPLS